MSVILNDVVSLVRNYISDTSEDRVKMPEMYSAITEAVTEIKEDMKGAMSNMTMVVDYLNDKHYYKVSPSEFSVLAANDLRVSLLDENGTRRFIPFTRTATDTIAADIAVGRKNDTYAIDRIDGNLFLVINHDSFGQVDYELLDSNKLSSAIAIGDTNTVTKTKIEGYEVMTIDLNPALPNEFAGIEVIFPTPYDLKKERYSGIIQGSVFIPDTIDVSSVDIKLESFDGVIYPYYNLSKTDLVDGWNDINLFLEDSIETLSPDISNIVGIKIEVNYSSAQNNTDVFSFKDFTLKRPSLLEFHYTSYSVGKNTTGDEVNEFTDITDIPYFSGQYDNLKFVVAKFAAATLFQSQRLHDDSVMQRNEGDKRLASIKNLIPTPHRVEMKSFKPTGANRRRRTL